MRLKYRFTRLMIATMAASTALGAPVAAAQEQWRTENPVFLIGVARDNSAPRTAQQYERFRQVIEQAIDMPVDVFVAVNLASLIDAHASGRVDYAPMTLLGYYTANTICDCSEPLVAPTTRDGATGIRSVLLAKQETVANMEQLAGKTVAYGPAISLAGALVPRVTFQYDGKPLEQSTLKLLESQSFDETMALLNTGEADAAFGWSYDGAQAQTSFEDSFATRAKQTYDMSLDQLWQSQPLPLGPHVVARAVPDEIKRILRTTMLTLDKEHPLAFDEISPQLAGPMRSVNAFDYRDAVEIIERAQP